MILGGEDSLPSRNDNSKEWVLLTGASGLLGSAMLTELLTRGHRVLCVVRATTPSKARQRLESALKPWGLAANHYFETGHLAAIRGDILLPSLGFDAAGIRRFGDMVRSVVHAAGSTAFNSQVDPDLSRANVDGTRHVFELAAACHCIDWHLISTAYVCGRIALVREEPTANPPDFRNDYERSKWMAEHATRTAANDCGAMLTTYRPGVIVGHSETGVITRYAGIYRVFRAVSLLARAASQDATIDRYRIPLQITGSAGSRPNLAFIDDVARDFAELFVRLDARGGVFHLTHPEPPSNAAIQSALEEYYDIRGGSFQDSTMPKAVASRTMYEDMFHEVVRDTEAYLFESPLFDRTQTDRFVSRRPACWNHERLLRLIDFAEKSGWRRSVNGVTDANHDTADIANYFNEFLPAAHQQFHLAQFAAMNLIVRYVIGESIHADWTCRFRDGHLVDVARTNGVAANVTYRIPEVIFWDIAAGIVTPANSFLSNQVEVDGDMECAMKFAAIQREFVREFPYRRLERQHDGR